MAQVLKHSPRNASVRSQRGDILLLSLVALVICVMGFIFASRQSLVDSQAIGNNLAHQKNAQVADIALRTLEGNILAVYAGKPLELGASTQVWWRNVAPGTLPPDANYWKTCLGNGNPALRCAQIPLQVNGTTIPYQVLAVIQPTGRTDANGCSLSLFQATWYDIHLNVREDNGATSATTETVYKLCTVL